MGFDLKAYFEVMQHSVNNSFDDNSTVPEGSKADTYYIGNPAPEPSTEQLQILYALESGQISREMAELALDALDLID